MDIVDKILFEALGINYKSKLNSLCKKYQSMGCQADVYERHYDCLYLSMIQVPKELRGQGIAKQFMNELCQLADEAQQVIALSPSKEFGSSIRRLKNFYKSFGFQDNKGSKADHRFTGVMIRYPKQ